MSLGRADESVMAHEINHNLDRSTTGTWGRHVSNPNCNHEFDPGNPPPPGCTRVWLSGVGRWGGYDPNYGCGAVGRNGNWPWNNDHIQEVGFDPSRRAVTGTGNRDTVIAANFPDLMSYCFSGDIPGNPANQVPPLWISPYRWTRLFKHFSTSASLLSRISLTNRFQEQIQTVYYVSGRVQRDGTGSLDPVLVQPGIPTEDIVPGDYAIEVRDADERSLLTLPFSMSFEDVEGRIVETVDFLF